MYRVVLLMVVIISFAMFVLSGPVTSIITAVFLSTLLLISVVAFGFLGVIDTLANIEQKIKK